MRRLPLSPVEAGTCTLPASAAHYLARVLRAKVGDRLEVFDPKSGAVAEARVVTVANEVVVEIGQPREGAREPALVLVQGYPKGDKLGDIVRDATELGATLIVPSICARSIARPDAAKASAKVDRLAAIAAEATRQCGRARAPELCAPLSLTVALEVVREHAAHIFVLWERATTPLGPDLAKVDAANGVAFVIGPEGGLTDDEVREAERAGCAIRSLGKTILRTETAATAVLGAYRVLVG
jgi:16S rRNA (uracil1498-N3)-methyltransferase